MSGFWDTAASVATVAAAVGVWRGLWVWQRTLVGTDEYTAARAALVALFAYRRTMQAIRGVFVDVGRPPLKDDEHRGAITFQVLDEESPQEKAFRSSSVEVIADGLRRLEESRRSLDEALLHVEALVPSTTFDALTDPLARIESQLHAAHAALAFAYRDDPAVLTGSYNERLWAPWTSVAADVLGEEITSLTDALERLLRYRMQRAAGK